MNSTGFLVFVRSALIACTWGLASLLGGCGGSSDGVGEPLTSVSAPVGATGGALELQGLALTLPANAIPETINLSITALTAGTGEIARFRLSPAGLALSTPAELRFSQAGMPAKASFFWDVGGELRLVPSLLVGDVLTAQILSLGLGSAGNTVSALGTSQTGLKRALAARPLAAPADDGGTVVVMPMDCAARIPEMAARLKRVAASDDSEAVIRAFDEIVAAKQLCLEAEVQALKDRSCEALDVAQLKAQSLVADSFKSFQELTLPLIAAEAFVQETGASCPSADSARVGPLIADKFDQFLRILQAQQLRGVFAEKATLRDIQELLSYQISCARLGLDAICERLDNEIFPNLFDGMRRGAFDECRSSGSPLVVSQLHFLGTSVTDTSTFLGFGRFGMADLEADMSYCTNPSLELRVFADAIGVPEELTDRASTLRPLVGLGNYVRSTTVAVPRDGKLTVSGELAALRCADDTVSPADLVVRIGSQEVARRSLSGNVYPLSTAPLDLVVSRMLASAGLDVDTTTSFTVSINREGGQCLGGLGPTLDDDFTLFEIRVSLAGPTAQPDNLRQAVQFPAELTGATMLAVTVETAVDQVFVPVPGAKVSIVNVSGGSCGTFDLLSAMTNGSGVATFTATPTGGCFGMSFTVISGVGTVLAENVFVRSAVRIPVFVGDLGISPDGNTVSQTAHLVEVTGSLFIGADESTVEPISFKLPNLKRIGGDFNAVVKKPGTVQLLALESVGGSIKVSSGAIFFGEPGSRLTNFEVPALKSVGGSIVIRDNPELLKVAIGPVRVNDAQELFIFKNGFPSFDDFNSGIVIGVGGNVSIFDNTGFSNRTALDFINRITVLGTSGFGRNTGR